MTKPRPAKPATPEAPQSPSQSGDHSQGTEKSQSPNKDFNDSAGTEEAPVSGEPMETEKADGWIGGFVCSQY